MSLIIRNLWMTFMYDTKYVKVKLMPIQLRLKCKMGQKVSAKLFMICSPYLQHTKQFAEDIIWHMMGPNKHGIERKKRGHPLYN